MQQPQLQLRKDPLSDRWVLMAGQRAARPDEFAHEPARRLARTCPFCAGHEARTPQALAQYPAGDEALWQIRVVPNKFPALQLPAEHTSAGDRLYQTAPATGLHEVIIESPDHVRDLLELNDRQLSWLFQAYRDRIRVCAAQPEIAYVLVFKNVGAAAGASIEHAHSQLLALPLVPTEVQRELRGADTLYGQLGCCPFCAMIRRELQSGCRVVAESPLFVAFCPFAARQAYETWILPKQHASHFAQQEVPSLEEAAGLLREVIRRLHRVHPHPHYNFVLHDAPADPTSLPHYHWHLEIIPRLQKTAGFEWGSGYYINTVPPETAAAQLRG